MALSITVTDNGDDTGATVAIAGSAGGTVEVFASVMDSAPSWSSQGTRAGDGNLTASLATGTHFFYAVEASANDLSLVKPVTVTDGVTSVFQRLLEYCVARIKALGLAGMTSANVRLNKVNWNRPKLDHGCFVMPVTEIFDPYTNATKKIKFGVQITAFRKSSKDEDDLGDVSTGNVLKWREQLEEGFDTHTPTTVAEIESLWVSPGHPIDIAAFDAGYDAEALVLRGRQSKQYVAA